MFCVSKAALFMHQGLTDSRDNHLTCCTDVLYSSMVDILSMGQTSFESGFISIFSSIGNLARLLGISAGLVAEHDEELPE